MKILDRYVIITFFKNYLISFLVLIGLYVALDMVFNFDDVVETSKNTGAQSIGVFRILSDIFMFYLYQVPLIYIHLSGVIAVVGTAFTLIKLTRFNELTAVLAAGVSLPRVAAPIVLAGIALNVLLVGDQELLIPQIIPKLIRSHDEMHSDTPKNYPVSMMQDDRNALFNASRYTPPTSDATAKVDYLDVIERDEQMRPTGHIYATLATWNPAAKSWTLSDGWRVAILRPEDRHFDQPVACSVYKSDINPEEIGLWRGSDFVQLLPTARINQLLNKSNSHGVRLYGQASLLRTKNMRFTTPLINIVLLMLAAPAVLSREPGRLKLAAMRCMVLTGGCMGTVFLAYQLSGNPPNVSWALQWPALMAWMPVFLYGPVSVWMWENVKT